MRQRPILTAILTLALGVTLGACERHGSGTGELSAVADPIVATYRGGEVTWDELASSIARLPAAQRNPSAEDFVTWHDEQLRRLVFDRIVLDGAKSRGEDQTATHRDACDELRKRAYADYVIRANIGELTEPEDEALRQLYEERRDKFRTNQRRLVHHIFKRVNEESEFDAVAARIAQLRDQIEAGASFGEVAERASDSETRHRSGSLGWLTPEVLPPDLREVLFASPPGSLSEPIRTSNGVHLFWIQSAIDSQEASFEELRPTLSAFLLNQSAGNSIQALAESVPRKGETFVPSDAQLRELLRQEDRQTLLLHLGPFALRLGELRDRAGMSAIEITPAHEQLLMSLYQELKNREIFYQSLLQREEGVPKELDAEVEFLCDQALVRTSVQHKVDTRLDDDPERLASYYRDNPHLFATEPRARIRAVRAPKQAGGSPAMMAAWEKAYRRIRRGEETFEEFAADLGLESEDLGWYDAKQLARRDRKAARLVFALPAGEVTAPYTTRTEIRMLQVVETEEARTPPFSQVSSDVRSTYLASYGQAIHTELIEETLRANRVQIIVKNLESRLSVPR